LWRHGKLPCCPCLESLLVVVLPEFPPYIFPSQSRFGGTRLWRNGKLPCFPDLELLLVVVLPDLPTYNFPSRSCFDGYPDFGSAGSYPVLRPGTPPGCRFTGYPTIYFPFTILLWYLSGLWCHGKLPCFPGLGSLLVESQLPVSLGLPYVPYIRDVW
ncbi:hypothetical protein AVEN_194762-1, partial [Araneus ventricosus]